MTTVVMKLEIRDKNEKESGKFNLQSRVDSGICGFWNTTSKMNKRRRKRKIGNIFPLFSFMTSMYLLSLSSTQNTEFCKLEECSSGFEVVKTKFCEVLLVILLCFFTFSILPTENWEQMRFKKEKKEKNDLTHLIPHHLPSFNVQLSKSMGKQGQTLLRLQIKNEDPTMVGTLLQQWRT